MEPLILALFALLLAAIGALAWKVKSAFRRTDEAREAIGKQVFERTLALDQRCDVLQRSVDELEQRQKIDHLLQLVLLNTTQGELSATVTQRLQRYVRALRVESYREIS